MSKRLGRDVYNNNCSHCHIRRESDEVPNLSKLSKETRSSLLKKIKLIDGDKNHGDLFHHINAQELKNLVDYITTFDSNQSIY
ncbi:MAG: cytochrome c [Raineya sp.]|nr:cytochrome c [Raineya sp.]